MFQRNAIRQGTLPGYFSGNLFDEEVKPALPERMSRITVPFRNRICAREPIEDVMCECFHRQSDVSLNLALPRIEGIHAADKSRFQPPILFREQELLQCGFQDRCFRHAWTFRCCAERIIQFG